jgi:hypothetical protein
LGTGGGFGKYFCAAGFLQRIQLQSDILILGGYRLSATFGGAKTRELA